MTSPCFARQAEVLRSDAPRLLLNCSRQSGKSTVTAVLAVHTSLYQPGALVLLLSPSLRQSQELFKKALAAYHALDQPPPTTEESALRIEFENGSRIVSLPGKSRPSAAALESSCPLRVTAETPSSTPRP